MKILQKSTELLAQGLSRLLTMSYHFEGRGEGCKVRLTLSQHLNIPLFSAGGPQKLDKRKYTSPRYSKK